MCLPGVSGELKSIVSIVGETRSIVVDGVDEEDRSIVSFTDIDDDDTVVVFVVVGVFGMVPVDIIVGGDFVIVPFDIIVGVFGIVPIDIMVGVDECKSIISCSSSSSVIVLITR